MTHLYHENKSIARLLGDVDTNTKDLSKNESSSFSPNDSGTLGLAVREEKYYKIKQKITPSISVKNFSRGSPGSDPDIEGAKSPIDVYENFAIVGASERVFIYKFITDKNTWLEIQTLVSPETTSSAIGYGESVSIYDKYCIVGARLVDSIGAVYLYEYSETLQIFEYKSKIVPTELQNIDITERQVDTGDDSKISNFGASIDIDGDTIVIGAPEWENQRSNNGIGGDWTYNGTTKVWTTSSAHNLSTSQLRNRAIYFFQSGGGATNYNINTVYRVNSIPSSTTITLSDKTTLVQVDSTVDSAGNWKAAKMDWNRGAVFVYTLSNNIWTQTQKLRPDFANPITSDSEEFGQSVRIYKNTIIVQSDGSGNTQDLIGTRPERIFIFNRFGESWQQVVNENFLHLSFNAFTKPPSSLNTNPFFGVNMSLYEDTLVLPAKRLTVQTNDQSSISGKRQGIVFIYKLDTNNIYSLSQRIIDENSKDDDLFGTDTSIYKDKLAISTSLNTKNTNLPGQGITGSNRDINFSGKIFVYKSINEQFIKIQEISALPEISADYLNFISVKLYKNLLFVGADGDKTITISSGGQYYKIYETFDILAAESITQTQNDVSISIGDKIGEGSVKYATGGVVSEIYIIRITPNNKQYYEGTFTTNNASADGSGLTGSIKRDGAVFIYEINKTYNHLNLDNTGGLITSGNIQNNSEFLQNDRGNIPLAIRDDYITPKTQNNDKTMPLQSTKTGALSTTLVIEIENELQYSLIHKLIAYDAVNNDYYGSSIDVMRDYIVVGVPTKRDSDGATEGAVYIYKKSFEKYEFLQKIDAELDLQNPTYYNNFGNVVRFDNYLNLYVGASSYNESGGTTDGAFAVFTFNKDLWSFKTVKTFTDPQSLSSETMLNTAHGQQFGYSIATDRRIFIVGSPYAHTSSNTDVGLVYQYGFNNGEFSIENEIDSSLSGNGNDDLTGYSIAIDGDNLMIGSYGYDSISDSTCDYSTSSTTISMDSSIFIVAGMSVFGTGIPNGATVSSVTTSPAEFVLSTTPTQTVVNGTLSFRDSTLKLGNVSFYKFTESIFDQHSTEPTKGTYTSVPGGGSNFRRSTEKGARNGASVAIHKNFAVHGAPETPETVGGNWTYANSGTLWTTSSSHNLIVGDIVMFTNINSNNSGLENSYSINKAYFVIETPSTTTLKLSDTSGGSVVSTSNNSNQNWIAERSNTGFIVPHIWSGTQWNAQSTIFPPGQSTVSSSYNFFAGSRFGESVDIHGDTLVVGAPYYDGGETNTSLGTNRGIVIVYKFDGSLFTLASVLYNKTNSEFFGSSVKIYDDIIIASAIGYSTNQGYVAVYEKNSSFARLKADKNGALKTTINNITPGSGPKNMCKADDTIHQTGDVGIMTLGVRNDTLASLCDQDGDYTPMQMSASGALFIAPGTGNSDLGKIEDSQHTSGDVGVMTLGVRNDTLASLCNQDGDYTPIQMSASGAVYIAPGTGNSDLGKIEDSQHTSGDVGVMALAVRQDTQADFGADGDYVPLSIDANGDLRIKLDDVSNTVLDTIASNTANIKASIELGGDLYVSQDQVESKLDHLSTDLDTIEATLTNIETDAAALEVLQTTTNTKLDTLDTDLKSHLTQNGDGTGNKAGVILDAINTNTITQNSKIDTTNTKLDTLETTLTAIETDAAALEVLQTSTNTKLDTLETTLTNIETDAAALEVLQTTTNTKLDTLETTLTNIETDAAALEVLQTSTNTKLDTLDTDLKSHLTQNGDGTGNKAGVILDAINTNTITQNSKIDTTNTKLDTLETTLTNIETDAAALEVLQTTTNTKLNGGLPSALTGGGNLKVCIQELGNEGSERLNTEANVSQLPSALTGSGNLKVSIAEADTSASGISTSANQSTIIGHLDGVEGKLDTLETTLTNIETDAAALEVLQTSTNTKLDTVESTLEIIEVDTAALVVSIATHLTQNGNGTGDKAGVILDAINTNTTTQNSKIDTTNTKLDTLETTLTAIETDAAALEVLQTTTNTKLNGGLPSALTGGGNLKVCIQELGNEGSERLNTEANVSQLPSALTGSGNLKVSIAEADTSASGISTSANQSTIIGHLDGVEGKLDTLETTLTNIETDAAALEVLQTSTNTKLDTLITNIGTDTSDSPISQTALLRVQKDIIDNKLGSIVTFLDKDSGTSFVNNLTNTKLDTLETTLTAIETDAAALEVLQTTTNTKLDTLETTLTNIETDAAALEVLQTTTNTHLTNIYSRQDDILTSNNATKISVASIDTKVSDISSQTSILTTIKDRLDPSFNNQASIKSNLDDVKTKLDTTNSTHLTNIYSRQDDILTSNNATKVSVASIDTKVSDISSQTSILTTIKDRLDPSFNNQAAIKSNLDDVKTKLDTTNSTHLTNIYSRQDDILTSNNATKISVASIDTKVTDISSQTSILTTIKDRLDPSFNNQAAIKSNLDDVKTKLDTVETTLTNIETDAAALEVLITATNSKLDTIKVDTEAIETAVEILDNCVATEDSATTPKGNLVMGRYDTSSRSLDNGDAGGIAVDVDGSVMTTSYMQTSNSPTTLKNNATFSANTFSSELDLLVNGRYYKDVTIYGTTTTATAKFHFALGHTSGTSNHFIHSDYATLTQRAATGVYHFVHSIKDVPTRYVSVYNDNTGDAAYVYMYAMISSH